MENRANKHATDLGVLGLEATKAALEKISPSVKLTTPIKTFEEEKLWGKETNDMLERKANHSRESRKRTSDKLDIVRYIVKYVLKLVILNRIFQYVMSKQNYLSSPTTIKYLSWFFIGLSQIYHWGASSKLNKQTGTIASLPFIGSLLAMATQKARFHDFILEMVRANNFNSVEFTVPNGSFLAVMDARDREYVLKTHFYNYLKNRENDSSSVEYIFAELMGRGIFATDLMEWKDTRKIASHMFSGAALTTQMEDIFNHHADRTVNLLKNHLANTGKTIDMQEVFQSAVFDAFCEIAFGVFPNAVDSAIEGAKPPFLVSFDYCQVVAAERFLLPPLIWNVQRVIGSLTGLGEEGKFMENLKVIDDYVTPIIENRKNDKDVHKKKDLLSLYIEHGRKTNQPYILENEYLRDTIVNFMIAGRDTTSCTLSYLMKFVSENRWVEQRLLEEDLKTIDSQYVTWEMTKTVPFADAVINETLRLAPPVGDDVRICVGDDVLPSGIKVRDGCKVLIANMSIGRDEFLWKNAEEFNPERWMSYDDKGVPFPVRRVDEYVHPIFFAGKRLCLGKDMARFESVVFMTKIFNQLRVIPVPNQDPATVSGPVIFLKHGNRCKIELR